METEGKWRVVDLDGVRERVRALGAEPGEIRQERNLLFRQPALPVLNRDSALRLRILGDGTGFLTFKGPRVAGTALKVRPEFETRVESPHATQEILEAMGFRVALEYAKTREIWRVPEVEIALDTFYGEFYVELEGPEAAVFRVASQIGLAPEEMDLEAYSRKKARRDAAGAPAAQ
jgi:predicted adenylyl cyclase CyaB